MHVDGRRINSCLTLAVRQQGKDITTIEGLATGGLLHPMQVAFVKHGGFQCGYCTPGQIMSAVACVRAGHATTDAQRREWMSGNLCRCGAYANILAAPNERCRDATLRVFRQNEPDQATSATTRREGSRLYTQRNPLSKWKPNRNSSKPTPRPAW